MVYSRDTVFYKEFPLKTQLDGVYELGSYLIQYIPPNDTLIPNTGYTEVELPDGLLIQDGMNFGDDFDNNVPIGREDTTYMEMNLNLDIMTGDWADVRSWILEEVYIPNNLEPSIVYYGQWIISLKYKLNGVQTERLLRRFSQLQVDNETSWNIGVSTEYQLKLAGTERVMFSRYKLTDLYKYIDDNPIQYGVFNLNNIYEIRTNTGSSIYYKVYYNYVFNENTEEWDKEDIKMIPVNSIQNVMETYFQNEDLAKYYYRWHEPNILFPKIFEDWKFYEPQASGFTDVGSEITSYNSLQIPLDYLNKDINIWDWINKTFENEAEYISITDIGTDLAFIVNRANLPTVTVGDVFLPIVDSCKLLRRRNFAGNITTNMTETYGEDKTESQTKIEGNIQNENSYSSEMLIDNQTHTTTKIKLNTQTGNRDLTNDKESGNQYKTGAFYTSFTQGRYIKVHDFCTAPTGEEPPFSYSVFLQYNSLSDYLPNWNWYANMRQVEGGINSTWNLIMASRYANTDLFSLELEAPISPETMFLRSGSNVNISANIINRTYFPTAIPTVGIVTSTKFNLDKKTVELKIETRSW